MGNDPVQGRELWSLVGSAPQSPSSMNGQPGTFAAIQNPPQILVWQEGEDLTRETIAPRSRWVRQGGAGLRGTHLHEP
jgi:hypothetical protein